MTSHFDLQKDVFSDRTGDQTLKNAVVSVPVDIIDDTHVSAGRVGVFLESLLCRLL